MIQNVHGLEEPTCAWRVIFSRGFCPYVMVLVLRVKKAASVMMSWQHDVLYFWFLSGQFYCVFNSIINQLLLCSKRRPGQEQEVNGASCHEEEAAMIL